MFGPWPASAWRGASVPRSLLPALCARGAGRAGLKRPGLGLRELPSLVGRVIEEFQPRLMAGGKPRVLAHHRYPLERSPRATPLALSSKCLIRRAAQRRLRVRWRGRLEAQHGVEELLEDGVALVLIASLRPVFFML